MSVKRKGVSEANLALKGGIIQNRIQDSHRQIVLIYIHEEIHIYIEYRQGSTGRCHWIGQQMLTDGL
jgi:hypothetical protein